MYVLWLSATEDNGGSKSVRFSEPPARNPSQDKAAKERTTDVATMAQPIRVNKQPPKQRVLTLEDLGKTPPLRNQDIRKGPRVSHRVLVFPFGEKAKDAWAKFYDLAQDEPSSMNRHLQVITELRHHLPRTCKLCLIPRKGDRNDSQHGYFVASNETPEQLALAKDLETIQRVMDILQAKKPPYWERPLRDCLSVMEHRWTSKTI
ncbi:hypothetical protein DXG03_007700 [Asterophora parasitica]|uniref:Uncharacterized protein n=1 Tax=Asterophora parasitica TaxID=117018 RepID=A0A9P7FY11_9AGAR|nr:hypothetical protein DXG03_007700 [Asterophora parasitica]